jgi:hypothetical protein
MEFWVWIGTPGPVEFWIWMILLSFVTGLVSRPAWTIVLWPAASIGIGVFLTVAAPDRDSPSSWLIVFTGLAALCTGSWLLGRGVATVARRLRGNERANARG